MFNGHNNNNNNNKLITIMETVNIITVTVERR